MQDGTNQNDAGMNSQGGAEFTPPPGQRLVSDAEYSSMEGWYKTAQNLGFKEPKEIESYKPFFEAHRTAKTDIGLLANIIRPNGGQPKPQNDKIGGPIDRDALRNELLAELRKEQALREHDEYAGKLPSMYEQALKEAVFAEQDEDLDPFLKELADARLLKARMEATYPEDHPLHGQRIGRLDEAKVKELASSLAEDRKKLAAWRMKAIGQAANRKPSAGSVAGASAGQGKPNKQESVHEEDRAAKMERVRQERERLMASAAPR